MSLRMPALFGLCLAALAPPLSASAPGAADVYQLSGARLLQLLNGDPDVVAGLEPHIAESRRHQASENARHYISGVADTVEGRQWCAGAGVLPHELADRVHTALGALPTAQLRQRASTLVIQALGDALPCRRG